MVTKEVKMMKALIPFLLRFVLAAALLLVTGKTAADIAQTSKMPVSLVRITSEIARSGTLPFSFEQVIRFFETTLDDRRTMTGETAALFNSGESGLQVHFCGEARRLGH
jgi:hypothetical protein